MKLLELFENDFRIAKGREYCNNLIPVVHFRPEDMICI